MAGIIVQCRLSSRRLPLKAFLDLNGSTVLQQVLRRCRASRLPVVLATPDNSGWLARICQHEDIRMYVYPDEDDVLGRYYHCALQFGFDPVVRITADCPLIEPSLIRDVVNLHCEGYDITATARGEIALQLGFDRRFPDGLDIECVSLSLLERMHRSLPAEDRYHREHPLSWAWEHAHELKYMLIEAGRDYDHVKLSLDDKGDYEVLSRAFEEYGDDVKWQKIVSRMPKMT